MIAFKVSTLKVIIPECNHKYTFFSLNVKLLDKLTNKMIKP
jgi:hypothetical protein